MKRRQTKNKDRILKLFEKNHMLSASEICTKIRNIDKSIVYRNIKKFTNDGVLKQVQTDDGLKYEVNEDNHQHFFCTECGDVLRIDIGVEKMLPALPEGAWATAWDLSVRGMCEKCMK